MTLRYRPAHPDDTPACVDLRGRTRQNAFSLAQLAAIGVTPESWRAAVASGDMPGHVCHDDQRLVGYCFGDRHSGEIIVPALLPEWEGRGIGRHLLGRVVDDVVAMGHTRLFLGCSADPATRSHGFYRHLGWRSTGTLDAAGDEVLAFFPPTASSAATAP